VKPDGAYRGTVRQQVQWYLAEGLAGIRAQPGPDSTEDRRGALVAFGAKLEALRYVEEMSEEERLDWYNRLLIALGIEPPPPAEPGTMRAFYIGPGSPPPPPAMGTPGSSSSEGRSLPKAASQVVNTTALCGM
jgi:hypothetical protein